MHDLTTVESVRAAIKAAPAVFVQPRFGCTETWVRISKQDALGMLRGMSGSADANEMSAGIYGTIEATGVYLG